MLAPLLAGGWADSAAGICRPVPPAPLAEAVPRGAADVRARARGYPARAGVRACPHTSTHRASGDLAPSYNARPALPPPVGDLLLSVADTPSRRSGRIPSAVPWGGEPRTPDSSTATRAPAFRGNLRPTSAGGLAPPALHPVPALLAAMCSPLRSPGCAGYAERLLG
ncbi:hypothetical protein C8F04DRAFT_1279103 [Mycena alexandri]|uniref:Uncharacterized protein n=1 Tax=Mycena alexandri TaxID=1745969 RepID=A0AAD6WM24_9AGAR|nr:hypothetical protein C8F04DRAFT_1279103 [Mycena alexandri]